jgi:exonuclease VII large subunit
MTLNELYSGLEKPLLALFSKYSTTTLGKLSVEKVFQKNNNAAAYIDVFQPGMKFHDKATIVVGRDEFDALKRQGVIISKESEIEITIKHIRFSTSNKLLIYASTARLSGDSALAIKVQEANNFIKNNIARMPARPLLPPRIKKVLSLTSASGSIADDVDNNISGNTIVAVTHRYCQDAKALTSAIKEQELYDRYDLIIIYRGGLFDISMLMFIEESVINAIIESKTPVLIALGHEQDRPPLYNLNVYDAPTPSAAGIFVRSYNDENQMAFKERVIVIKTHLDRLFAAQLQQAEQLSSKHNSYTLHIADLQESNHHQFMGRFYHFSSVITMQQYR